MHFNPQLIYVITALAFLALIIFLQMRYDLLNDKSTATNKPFSYSRVQLAWWTFIVLTAFFAMMLASGQIPDLRDSTLFLLGIGALTTGTARLIDISDAQKTSGDAAATQTLSVNRESDGFILDLLSDNNGVSIHRLQAVAFNLGIGIWFIYQCYGKMKGIGTLSIPGDLYAVMPLVTNNNLILLGISAGTYAALKTTENK